MASMLTLPILYLSLLGMTAAAQQDGAPQAQFDTPAILEEVIVTGRRCGDTGLTPELELGLEEIHAIGAYDVGEVVARLAETLSPDQPPIIIVNGRRIVNASDFLRFPPGRAGAGRSFAARSRRSLRRGPHPARDQHRRERFRFPAGARLGDGRVAPGYGRYDRDPIGRSVQLTVTRRF